MNDHIAAHAADSADATDPPASVRVRLEVPERVRAGDRVPIRLRIENALDRPVTIEHTGVALIADVVVTHVEGAVVWRSLDGQAVPTVLAVRTLAAREVVTVDASWDQRTGDGRPVAPGDFLVRGGVRTDGAALGAAPRPLRIIPR